MVRVIKETITETITMSDSVDVKGILHKIELSSDIPEDAKKAIKDFLKETFKESWNTINELMNVQPPTELLEYWDFVI